MQEYKDYLQRILNEGEVRKDRTGTGTISKFDEKMTFDLRKGFPLVTIKKTPMRLIFEELKWFLNGSTNAAELVRKNVDIWNKDAYRFFKQNNPSESITPELFRQRLISGHPDYEHYGELGSIYGKQWRAWETADGKVIDQITNVIESLKNDPHGRRHIVIAYNVGELDKMALPPCHYAFQFYLGEKGLSCKVQMRSNDAFLGAPFNIASYALLTHMVAQQIGSNVYKLTIDVGDAHIYLNHVEQVKLILEREPKTLPSLVLTKADSIDEYTYKNVTIVGYEPYDAVKGELSS